MRNEVNERKHFLSGLLRVGEIRQSSKALIIFMSNNAEIGTQCYREILLRCDLLCEYVNIYEILSYNEKLSSLVFISLWCRCLGNLKRILMSDVNKKSLIQTLRSDITAQIWIWILPWHDKYIDIPCVSELWNQPSPCYSDQQ